MQYVWPTMLMVQWSVKKMSDWKIKWGLVCGCQDENTGMRLEKANDGRVRNRISSNIRLNRSMFQSLNHIFIPVPTCS